MSETMRLNKYLSASGVCSRRKADEWIAAGRVTVNGVKADVGMSVSDRDTVCVDGKEIRNEEPFKDASGIFRNFDLSSDLKYIGRLDKDSEGLLLLTNDGDLCNEVAKARNKHEKEYVVKVNRTVTKDFLEGMAAGVRIYDQHKEEWQVTRPCVVKKLNENTFSIILTQGLNRQIRRMCEHFAYRVEELRRVRVMNIRLGEMKPGDIRSATKEEIMELRRQLGSRAQ